MKKLIIFICNGNIHRSVIAAESLRKVLKEQGTGSEFLVNSYGLQGTKGTKLPKHRRLSDYPAEWATAKPVLQKLSIDISKHRFQKINAGVMKKANVVVAMDNKVYSRAKNSLRQQFPTQVHKIHRFSDLTANHKSIKDLAGISSKKLHQEVIKNIYFTINKKYSTIINWAK